MGAPSAASVRSCRSSRSARHSAACAEPDESTMAADGVFVRRRWRPAGLAEALVGAELSLHHAAGRHPEGQPVEPRRLVAPAAHGLFVDRVFEQSGQVADRAGVARPPHDEHADLVQPERRVASQAVGRRPRRHGIGKERLPGPVLGRPVGALVGDEPEVDSQVAFGPGGGGEAASKDGGHRHPPRQALGRQGTAPRAGREARTRQAPSGRLGGSVGAPVSPVITVPPLSTGPPRARDARRAAASARSGRDASRATARPPPRIVRTACARGVHGGRPHPRTPPDRPPLWPILASR